VVEQVADGDARQTRIDANAGRRFEVFEDVECLLIERQLPLLNQLQNRQGGEALRHAGQTEERLRGGRLVRFVVLPAVAPGEEELAVADDGERHAGDAVPQHDLLDRRVERGEDGRRLARHRQPARTFRHGRLLCHGGAVDRRVPGNGQQQHTGQNDEASRAVVRHEAAP
jgi:hypothetical protein